MNARVPIGKRRRAQEQENEKGIKKDRNAERKKEVKIKRCKKWTLLHMPGI